MTTVVSNPFLDPILARHRSNPASLYGTFFDGDDWEQVTLGRFMDRACAYAATLGRHGIRSGDLVAIILRHGWNAEAAFLGAMLAGAIPSFLPYPNIKQDEHLYWRQHRLVFETVRPRLVIVYDELRDAIAECLAGLDSAVLPNDAVGGAGPSSPVNLPRASAIALLQHSSGTTGIKKGVALTYEAITRQIAAYAAAVDVSREAGSVIGTWLPLYHDMGLISSFLMPLHLGIPVAAIGPFDWTAEPGLLLDAIQDHGATHAWMPNFAFLHIARRATRRRSWRLDGLVALVNCSEPCKPQAFDAFLERFAPYGLRPEMLRTCYAMAETVFAVSQSPAGQPVRRLTVSRASVDSALWITAAVPGEPSLDLLSNGPPIAGCDVRILPVGDEPSAGANENRIGEIAVAAPLLFEGYHRNPTATAAALRNGLFRTGDLGFLHEGEVFVVGRLKDLIIVNGKNVVAHDAEAAASAVPGVKPGRTVAFGSYSDETGSEQLVVIAESELDAGAHDDLAREIYRAVLAEIGISCSAVRIVAPGWLVKTTSGKISRYDNQRKFDEVTRSAAAFRP